MDDVCFDPMRDLSLIVFFQLFRIEKTVEGDFKFSASAQIRDFVSCAVVWAAFCRKVVDLSGVRGPHCCRSSPQFNSSRDISFSPRKFELSNVSGPLSIEDFVCCRHIESYLTPGH